MSATTVFDAVTEMALLFTDYYGVDNVDLPNKAFTVPADAATGWARFRLEHTDAGQASLANANGNRRWSRSGVGTIELYTPLGVGAQIAYTTAEAVVNCYQGKRTASDVWFRSVRFEEITGA